MTALPGLLKRSAATLPTPAPKKAKVDEAELPCPINDLPDEILLPIFYEAARADLKNVRNLASVCKRWNVVAPDRLIYQLFIERKYPHLLPTTPTTGEYFERATRLGGDLARLSKDFSGKERNLANYSEYNQKVSASLTIPSEIYNAMPYFDLRCLAWLEASTWMSVFNKICPQLKNVQVLQASDIGKEIGFFKLKLPEIPLTGEVVGVGKVVLDGVSSFFGVEKASNRNKNINRFLVFCIHAVAKTSMKLKALHCANTTLNNEDVGMILRTFPSITFIDLTGCRKINHFAISQFQNQFPNVIIKIY